MKSPIEQVLEVLRILRERPSKMEIDIGLMQQLYTGVLSSIQADITELLGRRKLVRALILCISTSGSIRQTRRRISESTKKTIQVEVFFLGNKKP